MTPKRQSDAVVTGRLAANLTALMDRKGLSQLELERLSGVMPGTVSHILMAESCARVCTVARIAEALGVSVDRLLRPSLTARAPRSRRAARVS